VIASALLSLANIACGKKSLTFAQVLAILQAMRDAFRTVAALRRPWPRVQRFLYKGMAPVTKHDRGVPWATKTTSH
jgi:hypothetical protein